MNWHKLRPTTGPRSRAAIFAASLWLLAGCATRETEQERSADRAAAAAAILVLPLGVQTNVCVPARPGARYGVLTDDLGLLYLMGILP